MKVRELLREFCKKKVVLSRWPLMLESFLSIDFGALEEAVLEHVLVIIENPGNPTQKHEEINQPKIKTKINI